MQSIREDGLHKAVLYVKARARVALRAGDLACF